MSRKAAPVAAAIGALAVAGGIGLSLMMQSNERKERRPRNGKRKPKRSVPESP